MRAGRQIPCNSRRAGPHNCPGKELGLHFMRDFQFALQALFFLLLNDQLFQIVGHGVEGNLQRGQLVFFPYVDAMREVSAVDVLRGAVKIRD